MLALYRCDEVINEIMTHFADSIRSLPRVENVDINDVNEKSYTALKEQIKVLITEGDNTFTGKTTLYDAAICQSKQYQLGREMYKAVLPLYTSYLNEYRVLLKRRFDKLFQLALMKDPSSKNVVVTNFVSIATTLNDTTVKLLEDFVTSFSFFNDTEGEGGEGEARALYSNTVDVVTEDLKSSLKNSIADTREKQLDTLKSEILPMVTSQIKSKLEAAFLEASVEKMWDKAIALYTESIASVQEDVSSYLAGFEASSEEEKTCATKVQTVAFEIVTDVFNYIATSGGVAQAMRKQFNNSFNRDSDGLPRRPWRNGSEMRVCYKESREAAVAVLKLFSEKIPMDLPVLPITKVAAMEIERTFLEESERNFEVALREMESRTAGGNIPKWVYGVLFVLGWNEFIWMVSNPLLLPLVLLSGVGAFMFMQMPEVARETLLSTVTARAEEVLKSAGINVGGATASEDRGGAAKSGREIEMNSSVKGEKGTGKDKPKPAETKKND
jgi:hypothetical protein